MNIWMSPNTVDSILYRNVFMIEKCPAVQNDATDRPAQTKRMDASHPAYRKVGVVPRYGNPLVQSENITFQIFNFRLIKRHPLKVRVAQRAVCQCQRTSCDVKRNNASVADLSAFKGVNTLKQIRNMGIISTLTSRQLVKRNESFEKNQHVPQQKTAHRSKREVKACMLTPHIQKLGVSLPSRNGNRDKDSYRRTDRLRPTCQVGISVHPYDCLIKSFTSNDIRKLHMSSIVLPEGILA